MSMRLYDIFENDKLISEMPLKTITSYEKTNTGSGSFARAGDWKLVNKDSSDNKLFTLLKDNPHNFAFWFVNGEKPDYERVIGPVTGKQLHTKLGPTIAKHIMDERQSDRSVIHAVFTHNEGAQLIAMTPWIVFHRLGHMLIEDGYTSKNETFKKIFKLTSDFIYTYYDTPELRAAGHDVRMAVDTKLRTSGVKNGVSMIQHSAHQTLFHSFWSNVGDWNSARSNKIAHFGEVIFEMFACYLYKGSVMVRDIPDSFTVLNNEFVKSIGDDDVAFGMEVLISEINEIFKNILNESKHRIYML